MQLPGPIRAAVGLAASAAHEARHLPDRAIELPMLAVSSALQISLRAQQRYAQLTARGDEVLTGRSTTDDPPPWATFDDPAPTGDLRSLAQDQLGDSPDAARLLDELFGAATTDEPLTPPTPISAGKKPSPKKAATAGRKNGGKGEKAGKSVSKPRHTAPSKFDDAGD